MLASETLEGKSEHQSGTNLMHHLKARIILLTPIVLVKYHPERTLHPQGIEISDLFRYIKIGLPFFPYLYASIGRVSAIKTKIKTTRK